MRNRIAQLLFLVTKPSGMGMGLSICRPIVENHSARALQRSWNGDPAATFRSALRSHQKARP
jgi:signal transduction histidine kinase